MELNIMPFLPPAVPSSALGPSFLSLRECIRTGQTMYLQRNTEALSCNHCCSGKTISVTYLVF